MKNQAVSQADKAQSTLLSQRCATLLPVSSGMQGMALVLHAFWVVVRIIHQDNLVREVISIMSRVGAGQYSFNLDKICALSHSQMCA